MEAARPEAITTRILVAEDSPTQRQIIKAVLSKEGFDVVVAEDGIQAVSMALNEYPDILILDIDMPKMNGYQVCRLLKDDYRTTHIPVIMLTGREQETDKFWGLKTGANRYVTKGFQLSGLADVVRGLINELGTKPHPHKRPQDRSGENQHELDVLSRVNDLLDRKLYEATIINEISKLNTISEDYAVTISSVLSVIAKVTDCDVSSVLLIDEEEMVLHVHNPVGGHFFNEAQKRVFDAALPYMPSDSDFSKIKVITDAEPNFIEGKDPECDAIRSIYTMPLKARGKYVAVLTLLSPRQNAFANEVRGTMDIIENPASVVVDNARLHESAMPMAITDGLTKLYNHRHFYELLESEFKRTMRYMAQMALIMLDIDFFKAINDTYGHQVGDEILIGLAEVIKREVRDVDAVARYGGEEFAIMLPQTELKQASTVAERIRSAVEMHSFVTPVGKIKITVSLGVVGFPESPLDNHIEMVQLADAALYEAKESGKNMVKVSEGHGAT